MEAMLDTTFREQMKSIEGSLEEANIAVSKALDGRIEAIREYLLSNKSSFLDYELNHSNEKITEIEERFLNAIRTPHWATFQATLKHGGVFYSPSLGKTINLYEFLSQPIIKSMIGPWENFFSNAFLNAIQGTAECFRKQVIEYRESISQISATFDVVHFPTSRLTDYVDSLINNIELFVTQSEQNMSELVKNDKSRMSEVVLKEVRKKLSPVISKALDDSGPGVTRRRIDLLSNESSRLTKDVVKDLNIDVSISVQSTLEKFDESIFATRELISTEFSNMQLLCSDSSSGTDSSQTLNSIQASLMDLNMIWSQFEAQVQHLTLNLNKNGKQKVFIVDGSNMATVRINGAPRTSLAKLQQCIAALNFAYPDWDIHTVVDAGFRHHLDPKDLMEAKLFQELESTGYLTQLPANLPQGGDDLILTAARQKSGSVVSNDTFRQHVGAHPWLKEAHTRLTATDVGGSWVFAWADSKRY